MRGNRFGFVRFKKNDLDNTLEKSLQNVWIGKYKLIVNKPRFNRNRKRIFPAKNTSILNHKDLSKFPNINIRVDGGWPEETMAGWGEVSLSEEDDHEVEYFLNNLPAPLMVDSKRVQKKCDVIKAILVKKDGLKAKSFVDLEDNQHNRVGLDGGTSNGDFLHVVEESCSGNVLPSKI
ncbi:unnamed protein product [Lupinus luteus]|uniref:RRM domain-containing protein n=1 Tax=Lupinus luteus TaxID=3873 RepID=A0AAV1WFP2_LUPLU